MSVDSSIQTGVTARLDQLASDLYRYNDLDSPEYSPRKAQEAMRQRDLLENIGRIPDANLQGEVFNLANNGTPAEQNKLAQAMKRVDRFHGGSDAEYARRVRDELNRLAPQKA